MDSKYDSLKRERQFSTETQETCVCELQLRNTTFSSVMSMTSALITRSTSSTHSRVLTKHSCILMAVKFILHVSG